MKKLLAIISQTIKGGIFFLFPIILVIVFFEKAMHLLQPISAAFGEKLGLDSGIFETPYFLTLLFLILFCLLAGYIANQGVGKKMVLWIEDHILTLFPGYQLMKNTLQNSAGLDSEKNFPVVLVPIDGWMLAFKVDELSTGEFVVFVPGAPNTWEGNVIIFEKSKVKETNLSQKDVQKVMRQLGVNSNLILEKLQENPTAI
ncbi:DUF502 domain-containing protein [Algoriphagus pacificus]|uniref:DUF502 domain-containing protein n=1 Tax=Algoriphagus pacificus TaxID=2811234 RepID=A0ABS3CJA5_9BACT|nr:DUF502 domain-containing protein [Algoriphagus pacificus]MBN7816614.1 DUF502 domain-containing protein [Algoriphagus pacificus]